MTKLAHRIYIFTLSLVVVITLLYLTYIGISYYKTSLEERFFHPDHTYLKPSGNLGHGLGIIGSTLIIIGVFSYMARKRNRSLMRLGVLKHWLEFHIFLCTLGPVMILFHTAFKFGGLVAVSFWSMVAVFLSGIIGRFIYLQIPRTIEGRELSLGEVKELKNEISDLISQAYTINNLSHKPPEHQKRIQSLLRKERSLSRKIDRLVTMQSLFRYWHVAHLPFALIMLIIMIIHVIVTVVFGFRWIF